MIRLVLHRDEILSVLVPLGDLVTDFVSASDPEHLNGYTEGDILRILGTCVDDATLGAVWFAYEEKKLVGFCIIAVGPGIAHGTMEGQVIALHVDPRAGFHHHKDIAAAVREWATAKGLRRVVGGTQRESPAWERMGYAKVGALYSMELGGTS